APARRLSRPATAGLPAAPPRRAVDGAVGGVERLAEPFLQPCEEMRVPRPRRLGMGVASDIGDEIRRWRRARRLAGTGCCTTAAAARPDFGSAPPPGFPGLLPPSRTPGGALPADRELGPGSHDRRRCPRDRGSG